MAKNETTAKSSRRARGSLSKEEILDAAKALVEQDGLSHLNMPALAKRLNSGVTSIYWYFRSKDELVAALTEKVAREMYRGLPPVGDGTWDEELFDYFVAFRDLLNDTPIYREVFAFRSQLLYADGPIAQSVLRRLEEGMAIVVGAGMPSDEAAKLFGTCSTYARGYVLLEHGIATEAMSEARESTSDRRPASLVAANPERYPTLAGFHDLEQIFAMGDEEFRAGLRLILDEASRPSRRVVPLKLSASGPMQLERLTVIDTTPSGWPHAPASFHGRQLDRAIDEGQVTEELAEISMSGRTGDGAVLEELELTPASPFADDLLGRSAFKGFRRLLDPLRSGDVGELALRRLLWDLPLALMVSAQAHLLDRPDVPDRGPILAGAPTGINQSAGWVAGGQMLQLIEKSEGRLRMKPSQTLVGEDHLGDPSPIVLPAMSSRRRRRLAVAVDGDTLGITAIHRDSFADPDGVERVLHHWIISATADAARQEITSIEVTSGALPWVECPSAAGSGARVAHRRFDELEELVTLEFTGISTCTHLNGALIGLAAVPELLGRLGR